MPLSAMRVPDRIHAAAVPSLVPASRDAMNQREELAPERGHSLTRRRFPVRAEIPVLVPEHHQQILVKNREAVRTIDLEMILEKRFQTLWYVWMRATIECTQNPAGKPVEPAEPVDKNETAVGP